MVFIIRVVMLDKKYRKFKKPNIFQRNFSFAGQIGMAEFWSEVGVRLISLMCMAILTCIVIVVAVPGDTEDLIAIVDLVMPVLAVLWIGPIIALTRRRLRDAGYSARSYLWLLLPVIGWIIFLIHLCSKSK